MDNLIAHAEELYAAAAERVAPRLAAIDIAPGVDYLTEARHLQPLYRSALEEVATTAQPRPSVSPTLGHRLDAEWPRLGKFDVSLAWSQGTVFAELKCGADELTLSACGWDAAKCAFALRHGVGAAMVLVAAAPDGFWRPGSPGMEPLLGDEWDMEDIRTRYRKGFTRWERDGFKPRYVPRRLRTRGISRVGFAVAGKPWTLGVAAVEPVGEGWLAWQPFLVAADAERPEG